jgi:hypothetical protein
MLNVGQQHSRMLLGWREVYAMVQCSRLHLLSPYPVLCQRSIVIPTKEHIRKAMPKAFSHGLDHLGETILADKLLCRSS